MKKQPQQFPTPSMKNSVSNSSPKRKDRGEPDITTKKPKQELPELVELPRAVEYTEAEKQYKQFKDAFVQALTQKIASSEITKEGRTNTKLFDVVAQITSVICAERFYSVTELLQTLKNNLLPLTKMLATEKPSTWREGGKVIPHPLEGMLSEFLKEQTKLYTDELKEAGKKYEAKQSNVMVRNQATEIRDLETEKRNLNGSVIDLRGRLDQSILELDESRSLLNTTIEEEQKEKGEVIRLMQEIAKLKKENEQWKKLYLELTKKIQDGTVSNPFLNDVQKLLSGEVEPPREVSLTTEQSRERTSSFSGTSVAFFGGSESVLPQWMKQIPEAQKAATLRAIQTYKELAGKSKSELEKHNALKDFGIKLYQVYREMMSQSPAEATKRLAQKYLTGARDCLKVGTDPFPKSMKGADIFKLLASLGQPMFKALDKIVINYVSKNNSAEESAKIDLELQQMLDKAIKQGKRETNLWIAKAAIEFFEEEGRYFPKNEKLAKHFKEQLKTIEAAPSVTMKK